MDKGKSTASAVPAKEAAALLGISERHLLKLVAAGHLPKPIWLGRSKRWSRAALERWLAAEHREANDNGGGA